MAEDLNLVALVGRATRDAELRSTRSDTAVLSIRLAFTTRRKDGEQWTDRSNYVDVTVWGRRAAALAPYIVKGARIGIEGHLEWEEWESDAGKRQALKIVASRVQLLSPKDESAPAGARSSDLPTGQDWREQARGARPVDDEDIPF